MTLALISGRYRALFPGFAISVFAALAILCPTPALGQMDPRGPSAGLSLPDSSLTSTSAATSVHVNPAGLGFLQGLGLSYVLNAPDGDLRGVFPEGHGFFAATSIGRLGLGASAQFINRPSLGQALQEYRKFSLGIAWRPDTSWSLGLTGNWFGSSRDRRFDDLAAWDVGLQVRPLSWLGASLVFRDVNRPFLADERALPVHVSGGLLLRSTDGRWNAEAQASHAFDSQAARLSPRLSVEPIAGFRVFGQLDYALAWHNGADDFSFDGWISGLEVRTDFLAVQGSAHILTRPDDTRYGALYSQIDLQHEGRTLVDSRPRFWARVPLAGTIEESPVTALLGRDAPRIGDIVDRLASLADDPKLEGVVFEIRDSSLGYAQIWELHAAMDRLTSRGKITIAMLADTGTRPAFLASRAQYVWIEPSQPYGPTGLSTTLLSYQRALHNLGVEAQFVRVGRYKSAPEGFLRDSPSQAAADQIRRFQEQLRERVTRSLSRSVGSSPGTVVPVNFDAMPLSPNEALERRLVDAVVYLDDLDEEIERRYGRGRPQALSNVKTSNEGAWGPVARIGVVHVDGLIAEGTSGQTPLGGDAVTGSDTIVEVLNYLGNDPFTKAVVVRINSPGGSAVASDRIYRAIRKLAGRKPVIASMGNVAASGGYYVAAGANEIFATPLTLTGSIGVFAGKFSFEKILARLGVHAFALQQGERAGTYSVWAPWSEAERAGVTASVEHYYQLFLAQVAQSRRMSVRDLDERARGRVWSGEDAKDQGLVDRIGGLADAIERARELAGVQDTHVEVTPLPVRSQILAGSGILAQDARQVWQGLEAKNAPDSDLGVSPPYISQGLRRVLSEIERQALLPFYFQPGEALMLPDSPITQP